MTPEEYKILQKQIFDEDAVYWGTQGKIDEDARYRPRPYNSNTPYMVKYLSNKSKYKGSILKIQWIEGDRICTECSVPGAQKIRSISHFKNYELSREKEVKYVDNTAGDKPVKDFFDDDINIGDYVFGEYDRNVIFGIVRRTKQAEVADGQYISYRSKKLKNDAAIIEVVKYKLRNGGYVNGGQRLIEMKYFVKIEDPTLYLLKL